MANVRRHVAILMAVPPAIIRPIEPSWVNEVIQFWFEDIGEARWFAKSQLIDAQIRDRFRQLHERLLEHPGLEVSAPREILAAVIVLDQFSRNLFRGDPRAYSADPMARQLARAAIAQGLDMKMKDRQEKYFLYLPFEHSEDRADQALALAMIRQLGNEKWTRFTGTHMRIIERFGRFPHRNEALERVSTADELAFLKEPAILF
jgi:uncharacterized protein (DUF924 family)